MHRKLILVTNDDGLGTDGLATLMRCAAPLADVVAVVPSAPRSGTACGISVTAPVELKLVSQAPGQLVYSCSGTPVDCVKLGVEHVCQRTPDMVLSGVNHGDNLSISLHYSGTMGAVFEGCLKGVPAVGFSMAGWQPPYTFHLCQDHITTIIRRVLDHGLPAGTCLNVNLPRDVQPRGIRTTRLARGAWRTEWEPAQHPRGAQFYWLAGYFECLEPEAQDTDCWAVEHGYVSVTPIKMDMTAHALLSDSW